MVIMGGQRGKVGQGRSKMVKDVQLGSRIVRGSTRCMKGCPQEWHLPMEGQGGSREVGLPVCTSYQCA